MHTLVPKVTPVTDRHMKGRSSQASGESRSSHNKVALPRHPHGYTQEKQKRSAGEDVDEAEPHTRSREGLTERAQRKAGWRLLKQSTELPSDPGSLC